MIRKQIMWSRPFVVFSVLMLIKIYLSWTVIFGSVSIAKPILTGLPSVWVIFMLVELFARKHKLLWYMIANLIMTVIYFAAIMYFKYYGVIVNYRALKQVNQVVEVKGSVFSLMHPYYLLVFVDLIVLLGLFIFNKKIRNWGNPPLSIPKLGKWIALTAFTLICFALIWTNRAIVNEIKMAEQMGILNYEVYAIATGVNMEKADAASITPESVQLTKGNEDIVKPEHWGEAEERNIIVIQLESFQNLLLGLTIDGQEITPVLNRLREQSYYFSNFYQQIGQGNTSDAEYLTNTSLYAAPNGAASQEYSDKELPGMPRLVQKYGYQSLTFHTNDVTFWNRNKLYEALGFNHYYDRQFFGDEDQVLFAASDEVLYRKTAEELARFQGEGQKFYAHVVSLTQHHPFTLPPEKNPISLPEQYDGTLVGNYFKSAHYADFALGTFIEQLKQSGIWDHSMIVIYGDHFGLPINSLTPEEKDMLSEITGREYGYTDMFNIPLIISIPGVTDQAGAKQGQTFEHLGGQVDTMPTIANLAGFSLEDQIVFGQDLLNHRENLLPMRYYLPRGSFINDETIFVPGESVEDGVTYPLKMTKEITAPERLKTDFDYALNLLQMSDDYVKTLPKLREKAEENQIQQ